MSVNCPYKPADAYLGGNRRKYDEDGGDGDEILVLRFVVRRDGRI